MLRFKPIEAEEDAMEEDLFAVTLFPKGTYSFTVKSAEIRMSKNGNEMIALQLVITDNKGVETTVYDYLLEAMLYKLMHFCKAIGQEAWLKHGQINPDSCIGLTGQCKIEITESNGYAAKNVVKDYVVKKPDAVLQIQPANTANTANTFVDDTLESLDSIDVPF